MPLISPRLWRTARRYARKHKGRTIALAMLFLLLTALGWQMGALLSAKLARMEPAHTNERRNSHPDRKGVAVAEIEEDQACLRKKCHFHTRCSIRSLIMKRIKNASIAMLRPCSLPCLTFQDAR